VSHLVDDVRLLSYREKQELFPDCEIRRERLFGLTKSYSLSAPSPEDPAEHTVFIRREARPQSLESWANATLGGSPKGGGRSPRRVESAARELSWRPGSPLPSTERIV
jgi:hypothetical protein